MIEHFQKIKMNCLDLMLEKRDRRQFGLTLTRGG
jgi:hypothetical protein